MRTFKSNARARTILKILLTLIESEVEQKICSVSLVRDLEHTRGARIA